MVDDILVRHRFDLSERPDHDLCWCCPRCASFHSSKSAPDSELRECNESGRVREVFFCNCHGKREELFNAHELGCDTPAMNWEYEALKFIERKLDKERDSVLKMMANYSGQY